MVEVDERRRGERCGFTDHQGRFQIVVPAGAASLASHRDRQDRHLLTTARLVQPHPDGRAQDQDACLLRASRESIENHQPW
jgi:hypothetical protein